MTGRHGLARPLSLLTPVLIVLLVLVRPVVSTATPVENEVLIDDNSPGYYHNIGNKLDGLLPWFPLPIPPGPDPTLIDAPEPDPEELVSRANLAALLDDDPMPLLTSEWTYLQKIPFFWTSTNENALIYEIDAGPLGIKNLVGNFGVDNGIYIWVNGRYKFGAMEPGAAIRFEYPGIPLDDLGPGMNYLQIIREDHGFGTGYYIEVTGTRNTGDTILSARTESATVRYDGREKPPGHIFYPEACPAGATPPCSPSIEMRSPQNQPDKPAAIAISCQDAKLQNLLVSLINGLALSGLQDDDPLTIDDLVWALIENGYDTALGIAEDCANLANPLSRLSTDLLPITIRLENGSFLLDFLDPNVRWRTMTPVGDFTLEEPGLAAVGYNPETGRAGALAIDTPVLVEPTGGSPFTLDPGTQVTLTEASVGPVTDLPQAFIPAISR
jgi:hypothetical protein